VVEVEILQTLLETRVGVFDLLLLFDVLTQIHCAEHRSQRAALEDQRENQQDVHTVLEQVHFKHHSLGVQSQQLPQQAFEPAHRKHH